MSLKLTLRSVIKRYDLKHELISVQIKYDAAQQEIKDLKKEINENQKSIVKLETELNDLSK